MVFLHGDVERRETVPADPVQVGAAGEQVLGGVPLAAVRGQSIELRIPSGLYWDAPWDVVETLLANLLLNAIQHGGEGVVALEADGAALTLRNPPDPAAAAGFGLGLRIVERLAARIGWQVAFARRADSVSCQVRWAQATD